MVEFGEEVGGGGFHLHGHHFDAAGEVAVGGEARHGNGEADDGGVEGFGNASGDDDGIARAADFGEDRDEAGEGSEQAEEGAGAGGDLEDDEAFFHAGDFVARGGLDSFEVFGFRPVEVVEEGAEDAGNGGGAGVHFLEKRFEGVAGFEGFDGVGDLPWDDGGFAEAPHPEQNRGERDDRK